jgi:hypothetical protein
VWRGVMRDYIIELFFFSVNTVTANIYLDILNLFVFLQIDGIEQEEAD